ncbi:MAG: AAA family ATPase [Lachnospiraceae bacterium]|nr:AAA family ATPase [Lachnospiraceae bacterium]
MVRPKDFNDIVGHDWLVQYFRDHILKGTLPHFLILEGSEGLGKTSFADIIALNLVYGAENSKEKQTAYETVVKHKQSNDYIKKFEMSVEGGKEVAKEVRAEMNATFTLQRKKVIICDECHNLSDAAQDVFLAETEYINDKVYIIMLTTESDRLKPSLKSRAVPIHLNTLKQADMVRVLRNEVAARNLKIQSEDATLTMIAEWSEGKPRTGLNILNAFSAGSTVSSNMIRELIGYMDIRDLIPLLASLSGSMTFGLSYISEMKVDASMISLVTEAIRVKSGEGSYKIKMNDLSYLREQLSNVTVQQLVMFLYGLTRHTRLTRTDVINAYISAHQSWKDLTKSDTTEMFEVEKAQKAQVIVDNTVASVNKAPTLEDLLQGADLIE